MLATYLHYRWVDETVKAPKEANEKALQANLLFGVLDDNLDGKLQVAELRGQLGEQLKKFLPLIDKDHDNAINATEWAEVQKMMPKGRRGAFGNGGGGGAGGAQPMPAAKSTASAGGGQAPGGR
jgi:hypothetical protein